MLTTDRVPRSIARLHWPTFTMRSASCVLWSCQVTEDTILQLVREQLQKHHPGGVTLNIGPGPIRRREEFWYVPVLPSAEPPKMFEYYEALADVEATLEE